MQSSVLQGILLPFWGTSLGAACVFCLQRAPSAVLRRVLEGFAAGVMTAASVWSLLLPAIDWADMGRWSFLPAAGGFWLGVLFLRLLERLLPEAVTDRSTTMTLLAVTLHNIPEGMAVGAAYAGCVAAGAAAPAAAFTLALAIAMPLRTAGAGKGRAFLGGVLSGAVEPLAAGVTVLAAALIVPALPWLLGFAAGAMLYVVAAELLPTRGDSGPGALAFAAGFTVMMILDVALGEGGGLTTANSCNIMSLTSK